MLFFQSKVIRWSLIACGHVPELATFSNQGKSGRWESLPMDLMISLLFPVPRSSNEHGTARYRLAPFSLRLSFSFVLCLECVGMQMCALGLYPDVHGAVLMQDIQLFENEESSDSPALRMSLRKLESFSRVNLGSILRLEGNCRDSPPPPFLRCPLGILRPSVFCRDWPVRRNVCFPPVNHGTKLMLWDQSVISASFMHVAC